jgi:hypothetical protein
LRRRIGGRARASLLLLLVLVLVLLPLRRVRKACQAKRLARAKSPVRRGARKMAEDQVGDLDAFWKGKTMRVADAILLGG